MTRILAATAPILALPAAAFAHGGPAGHAHPHGLEIAALGALALVAIWALRRSLR
jgi:MYXO-CTERM domain-containing protein